MLLLLQLDNKIIDYLETDEIKWLSTLYQTKLKLQLLERNEDMLEVAKEEPIFFIQKRFTPLLVSLSKSD